jgi:hypothetical protein
MQDTHTVRLSVPLVTFSRQDSMCCIINTALEKVITDVGIQNDDTVFINW